MNESVLIFARAGRSRTEAFMVPGERNARNNEDEDNDVEHDFVGFDARFVRPSVSEPFALRRLHYTRGSGVFIGLMQSDVPNRRSAEVHPISETSLLAKIIGC